MAQRKKRRTKKQGVFYRAGKAFGHGSANAVQESLENFERRIKQEASLGAKAAEEFAQEARAQTIQAKDEMRTELKKIEIKAQEMLAEIERKKTEVEDMTKQAIQKSLQIDEVVQQIAQNEAKTRTDIHNLQNTLNAFKGTVVTNNQFADINKQYADVLARVEQHTKDIASINEKINKENQDFETDLNETKSNVSELETRANKLETRAENARLDLKVLHAQSKLRNIKLSELRKAFSDKPNEDTQSTKLRKRRDLQRPPETEVALKL